MELYHLPYHRSTRVLWLYLELANIYRKSNTPLPELVVKEFQNEQQFRLHKPDWYLRLNPNGKVPTFIDTSNEVTMWESCAICTYLLEYYDPRRMLLSGNPSDRSLYHQLSYFVSGTLDNLNALSSPVQRGIIEKNEYSPGNMPPSYSSSKHLLSKAAWDDYIAPYFERLLKLNDCPYLLCDKFTAVDLVFASSLDGIHDAFVRDGKHGWLSELSSPLLCKYYETVKARDCYKIAYSETKDWKKYESTGVYTPSVSIVEQYIPNE